MQLKPVLGYAYTNLPSRPDTGPPSYTAHETAAQGPHHGRPTRQHGTGPPPEGETKVVQEAEVCGETVQSA